MKKVFLFCLILVLCLRGISQFPFTTVFPSDVSAHAFGDTLLNTRSIMPRENIRKVTAIQISNKDKHSWITEYLITNGRIDKRNWRFLRTPGGDTSWWSNDTI